VFAALLAVLLGLTVWAQPPAEDDAGEPEADDAKTSVYERWTGRDADELQAWLGEPTRVERSEQRGTVLVYELKITCNGSVQGRVFNRVAPGLVVGSQDPRDQPRDPGAVSPGAPPRVGKRVAAEQTVRFFVDASGVIERHESGKTRTHWKRCGL